MTAYMHMGIIHSPYYSFMICRTSSEASFMGCYAAPPSSQFGPASQRPSP